jgi:hypothetical protein
MNTEAIEAPAAPRVRLSIGITGHRTSHPVYWQNVVQVEAALREIFDLIAASVTTETAQFLNEKFARTRVHSMLSVGADQLGAREALDRGWELIAPLPFGHDLNCAINALPMHASDARALVAGNSAMDLQTEMRVRQIRDLYAKAQLFELADDDEQIASEFLAMHDVPDDESLETIFLADAAERVALAARLLIEQSDFIVAMWDGARSTIIGGTGHTVAMALDMGAAVVWIDVAAPAEWRILYAPEALTCLHCDGPSANRNAQLARLVHNALCPTDAIEDKSKANAKLEHLGISALDAAEWRSQSNPLWHWYRRVETIFGGEKGRNPWRSLRATYLPPRAMVAAGQDAMVIGARALPGADADFAKKIETSILSRFAWADGISSYLSDTYRGGMVINFGLSSFAIVGGIAYMPFASYHEKWIFGLFELVLLSTILTITFVGRRRRWHGRWFETRRVAEYLRHSPLLLTLGAARPPGRWPKGAETSWPEHYARHSLREAGLPRVIVTATYLRHVLTHLLAPHVSTQRDYHHAKARKLTTVHRNLDRLSTLMFQIAVLSVAIYLMIALAGAFHLFHDEHFLEKAAKTFSFLGVMFPTIGGAIAGIRYFGDFERFAAISEVTALKLDAVHGRIQLLLKASDRNLDYGPVAELAHAADDIVITEIENWQAVFGGKHITVPV